MIPFIKQMTLETYVDCKKWYVNNVLHRDGDLPAIEWSDGDREWYQNGLLHRDGDLPAIEWSDDTKMWYKHGKLHRDNDLPAVKWSDGHTEWWVDGNRHREGDLPAIINSTETREWLCWYKNGNLHREDDKYAVSYDNTFKWYKDGKLYRENGFPCVITDNICEWWKDGKCINRMTVKYFEAILKVRKFRKRIKHISSLFGVNSRKFYKLSVMVKSRPFIEWWYHPENYGGKRHKRIMTEWVNQKLNIN